MGGFLEGERGVGGSLCPKSLADEGAYMHPVPRGVAPGPRGSEGEEVGDDRVAKQVNGEEMEETIVFKWNEM